MCGIAGIVRADREPVSPEMLTALGQRLAHRGPDDHGLLAWDGDNAPIITQDPSAARGSVAFVHRRLTILDLTEAGRQPMSSRDGRFHLVYNGEIYNFEAIRRELQAEGDEFTSSSDSEVLLAAWARWGEAALDRIVGMFAFAMLDTEAGRLHLVRDAVGIKPLYWARWSHGIAFASEPTPLLDLPGVPRQADTARLFDYLRFGISEQDDGTMFSAVRQVPPGHVLDITIRPLDVRTPRQWFEVPVQPASTASMAECADHLRSLLRESVRQHLRSDVPVGMALSGGIDSSGIVALAREIGGDDLELHAFSFVVDDPERGEERWMRLAAASARATVHVVRPTADEFERDLDDLIASQGEPVGSTSIYAQYRMFQLAAAQGVKVVLEGQGADELFAGYLPLLGARVATLVRAGRVADAARFVYRAARRTGTSRRELWMRAAALLTPQAIQSLPRRLTGRSVVPDWLDAGAFRERGVRPVAAWRATDGARDLLRDQLRRSVFRSSLPRLLRYGDRCAMAFSLENRVPFLSPDIVRYAATIPEAHLMGSDDDAGTTKAVLRAALRGAVPDAILDRRDKLGFATPQPLWLDAMRTTLGEIVHRSPLADAGLIAPEGARRLLARRRSEFEGAPGDDLWRLANASRWCELAGVTP